MTLDVTATVVARLDDAAIPADTASEDEEDTVAAGPLVLAVNTEEEPAAEQPPAA